MNRDEMGRGNVLDPRIPWLCSGTTSGELSIHGSDGQGFECLGRTEALSGRASLITDIYYLLSTPPHLLKLLTFRRGVVFQGAYTP